MWWRFIKRAAAALIGLMVLAIVAGVVLVNTEWFRDFARDKANAILGGTFKGQVVIGAIHGSIWRDLTLDDITLTYRGERIAHIERLRVAYGILSILHNTIDLTHLDLSGVQLDAKQDPDHKWNAVEALASAQPEAPAEKGGAPSRFRVLVREVSLGRASIRATLGSGETYAIDDAGLGGSVYILKDGIRARLASLWGRASGPQLPPGDIFATLAYQSVLNPPNVKIDVAKIDTHDSHLKLTGAIVDLNALKVDLQLATDVGAADITRFVKSWSPRANVMGSIRIEGTRPDLHAALAMKAGDAKIDGDVRADLSASEPRYRGAISVANLDPQQLLTIDVASGVVNASIKGAGSGTSPAAFKGHADVKILHPAVQQWTASDLVASADVADGIATYDARIAEGKIGAATSRGRIDFRATPKYEASLTTNHLNLQKLQNQHIMRSDLNLSAHITGSGIKLEDAAAVARVDIKRSVLGPVRIDAGAVRASMARGTLQVVQASLNAGATKASVKGQIALTGIRRGDISYNLKSDDLAPWMTLAGRSGSGKLHVVGRAAGPLDSLGVNGSASMTTLQSEGVSIGAGKVTYSLAGVGNDNARGRIDAGFDVVHTNVDLKSLYIGVDLVRLKPADARIQIESWDANSRDQKLAGEIHLTPDGIDASLTQLALELSDGTWRLLSPASFHKDARQIAIQNLRLVNGQREISLEGQVAFQGAQNVTLLVSGFDLADLNPFLPNNPTLGGTLSTLVRVTGTSAMPTITAQAQIKTLSARGYVLSEVDAKAKYGSGQMVAAAEVYQDAKNQIVANATIPMELGWDQHFVAYPSGGINGRIRSSGIGLAFLNSMNLRAVREIYGKVSMDVAFTGSIKHPEVNGGIWLWGGKARIVQTGVNLEAVNMTMLISPQAIFLKDLNARAKDGTIDAWGQIALNGYTPSAVDLGLKMVNWPAITTTQYVAYTAADLRLNGTLEAPKLAGKAEVLWGVFKPDLAFLGSDTIKRDHTIEIVYNGVAPPPTPPPPPSPFKNVFRNLAIDLIAEIHHDTWIKVAGSSAELEGKVHVVKKPAGPLTLIGSVHSVRGQIALAGQPLTVQKAEVTFTGGADIDPTLDIVAQRKLPQYIVSANISGTAKKPQLTFSSEPAMSQADILSILMFGQPASQLNNNQQASLQNQAATIAGSYAANQIGQSVADALGLQALQFSVESGMASIGTYVTEDVFLSASQNLAPQTQQIPGQPTQKATLQYYLTQHFELDTSQSRSSLGNASELNLIWHTQY